MCVWFGADKGDKQRTKHDQTKAQHNRLYTMEGYCIYFHLHDLLPTSINLILHDSNSMDLQ